METDGYGFLRRERASARQVAPASSRETEIPETPAG
jgi:hypothetical protein